MVSTNIAVTIQLLYMSIIANELYITLAASLGNHPHSHSHHHHNYHHLNLPSDQHQQQQQHVLHSSTLPSSTTTTNLYDATFIQHQRGQNDSLSSSSKSTVNGTDNNKLRSDDQIYTQNIHHTHKHHTSSSHHTHVHPNVQRAAAPIISSIGSKLPPSTGSQHFGGQHGRPLVRTSKGVLRGITIQTPTGKYVDAFLGIPYAAPPTGQYRFRHPKPMQQWDGEYDATKFSPGCYQLNDTAFGNFSGSMMWNPNVPVDEDCLTLNIWVPKKRRSNGNNMACLLWIYGGGFSTGTTSLDVYNGSILAGEESIIVISVNYRLASLGFIYLGREDAPGNAGLFDQLMAIEWVRDNIAAFGGNPANITLFGESAGAASIAFHLLSPLSRNLFSQGILQSGSSTSPWAYIDRTEAFRRSLTLAKNIGCEISSSLNSFLTHSSSSTASSSSSSSPPSSSNSLPYISDKHLDKIIHCLQEADPIQLLTNEPPVKGVVDFAFVPIVDGSFLDEKPEVSLKSKNFKQTNLLVGSNHDEGTYWLVYHEPKLFNLTENVYVSRAEFEGYVKKLFADNPWIIQEAIMQEYTPWLNPDNQTENRDKIDKLVGDYHFACPGIEMAHRYAFYGNNVWNYYFTHRSSRSPWPSWMGVIHADEIMFLLGEPLNPELHYRDDEKELSTRMMRYWANFARTGDPNKQYPDDEHDLPSVRWPEYTAHGREYLVLSSTDKSTGRGLRAKECAFWNNFLPKLMKHNEDQKTCTNKSTSIFIQSISSFIFLLIFSLVLSVLFGPPSQ